MKKFSSFHKILLVVATVALLAGLLMVGAALGLARFDFAALSTSEPYQQEHYTLSQSDGVDIVYEGVSHNLRVERSAESAIEVEYWSNDRQTYTFDTTTSTLRIVEKHRFSLLPFDSDFQDRTTTLRLPASFNGSLILSTASGTIRVSDLGTVNEMSLSTTSGDIEASDLRVKDALRASSSSGDISITGITTESASVHTTSGNSNLSDVTLKASLDVGTASGNIDFERLRVSHVELKSTSGDVKGSILGSSEDYTIDARSVSGSLSLPKGASQADKSLAVKTSSGNVDISFLEGK
jgi:DUF4097 and DUF4098 domain-containing protein YvlB